ncbi:MAG: recombination protein RecR [Clostridia bacterium]|nr:recombination protein RecR [Clostridia bacterium]
MANNLTPMEKLVYAFTRLPGVGKKTAERYAYNVINMDKDDVNLFAEALVEAKEKIKYCDVCGDFTDKDICDICSNRKSNIVCVVKAPKDVAVLEKAGKLHCLYHVLHGTISPLENRGPNDIRIKELIERINQGEITEVILATNPDVEGEVTASYIAKLVKPLGIKVSRLAQGIQMGSDLQYADEVTIGKALEDRKEL